MALALNVFQTIAQVVQNVEDEVYTAPVGYTGVVLLAQVTNTGAQSHDITLIHRRDIGGGTEVDTPMLQAYPIPALGSKFRVLPVDTFTVVPNDTDPLKLDSPPTSKDP